MALTTLTYDLTGGTATVPVQALGKDSRSTKVSYHLSGDGAVNGTATVKLQESNVHDAGQLDISGATAVANVSTEEYVGEFVQGGGFLNFVVTLGTATAGTVTLTLRTS